MNYVIPIQPFNFGEEVLFLPILEKKSLFLREHSFKKNLLTKIVWRSATWAQRTNCWHFVNNLTNKPDIFFMYVTINICYLSFLGLSGSLISFLWYVIYKSSERPIFFITWKRESVFADGAKAEVKGIIIWWFGHTVDSTYNSLFFRPQDVVLMTD